MNYTDNEQKRIFADNLSRLLSDNNIKKVELAEAMGVSPSAVSHWLDGETIPRAKMIQNIARFFRVNMSDLVEPYNPKSTGNTLDMLALIKFINNDANTIIYNGKELSSEQRAAAKAALSVFKTIVDAK